MALRTFSAAIVLQALCVAGGAPAAHALEPLPPNVAGAVRFEPAEDEVRTDPRFRLAAHEFPYVQTFAPADAAQLELSHVTFPSPVETPFACNNTVHCEYFRPRVAGRRPAVVVLHILGGDFPLARLFCRYLAASGTAALFVKMPYYGPRRPSGPRKRMISDDPRETVEGMRQAVLDIRRAAAWLAAREEVDAHRLGIFGISLGGITAALAAAQEPRFANVCLMLAGGDLGQVVWQTREAARAREKWLTSGGTVEQFVDILRAVDPAAYAGRLQGRRLLMLNAANDEVIPRACTESLWRASGRPPIVWYDAGHYSVVRFLFDGLYETTRFFRTSIPPAPPKPL